jgi:hypothetical protein
VSRAAANEGEIKAWIIFPALPGGASIISGTKNEYRDAAHRITSSLDFQGVGGG